LSYRTLFAALNEIGLSGTLLAANGAKKKLPTTTVAGVFESESENALVHSLFGEIKQTMIRLGLHGEFFVAVGGRWVWGQARF